jgi:hypothetical protein
VSTFFAFQKQTARVIVIVIINHNSFRLGARERFFGVPWVWSKYLLARGVAT